MDILQLHARELYVYMRWTDVAMAVKLMLLAKAIGVSCMSVLCS